jgi:hypothetical protein
MGKQLHATIEVGATPRRVWQVLTGFAAYPDRNPFITRASGTARPGERPHLRMQPPGGRGVALRPVVLEADPGRRLRWLGQQERFRGILVPLAAASLDRHTLPGLQQPNQALKRRAEQPSTKRFRAG